MAPKTTSTRPYRGLSQEERRAERRNRLIAAAIKVYGERGYRQASVKAVCEVAGLTERYFYESFGNSEELLVASYNAVTYGVFKEVTAAAEAAGSVRLDRARAMLNAYFSALKREPHSARVFLVEIRGVSLAVDDAFDAALRKICQQITQVLGYQQSVSGELLALGVVGGIIHIAQHWIKQDYTPTIEELTDTALQLGTALLRQP